MPSKAPKLGQPNPLNGNRWIDWLHHVRDHYGGKYFLALYLTQALCIRISQALQLQASHFDFKAQTVFIAAFKGHSAVKKPLVPSVRQALQTIKLKGVDSSEKQNFQWPKRGYLFPARRGAKKPYMTRFVVAHTVAKARKSFLKKYAHKYPDLETGKTIRSHSGRRHAITAYAESGLSPHIGMAYAQITSFRVYQKYVDMTPESTKANMKNMDKKARLGRV